MSSAATTIPRASEGGNARHVLKGLASMGTACIAGLVLLGWTIGSRSLISIVPGTVPMHPLTAMLFAISAVALSLAGARPLRGRRNIGLVCAATVVVAGAARLAAYGAAPGFAIDHLLFRETLARVSAEFAPTRIQMAPNTSINFVLIGAALLIAQGRWRQFKFVAFILALASLLIAALTVVGFFINVSSLGSVVPHLPMSLSTAIAFSLLASGILAERCEPWGGPMSKGGDETSTPAGSWGAASDNRVAIGFSAALFMLVGIGIVSYKSIGQFVSDSRWNDHTYQVLATLHSLRADIKDAESETRGYVITGDRKYLDSYQAAVVEIGPRLEMLKDLTADNPDQQRRISTLGPRIQAKLDLLRQKQDLRTAGFEIASEAPLVAQGERLMEDIDVVLRRMATEENQLLVERINGTEANASRAIRLITAGGGLALVLVLLAGWKTSRDIARRMRTEVALRASDKMFRGLLESAPDAMVIVNENGRIELFNAQAKNMFGYSAEELRGQLIELIIREGFDIAAAESHGPEAARERVGITKNGVEIPVEISFSPVRTAEGLRISSAIRDITRQKREADELRHLNATLRARTTQLEAANKELESFSYSVSHDLRTPLRSIDGFSQALLDDNAGKLDAESQDHLCRVRAASQKMGQLIDDLLNLARVTRVEMRRERVDLSRLAREIVEELRDAAPERNTEVVIADGLFGDADPALLRVVLSNLLGNAWKFTGKCDRARIEFGYCFEGNPGYFVRDNGAGFDMTYGDKLFGAFQRLHSAAEFPGTGIGLATVKRIIHRHGGRVWAEGGVQTGATFHFALSSAA